jgi:inorganic pyrophosphatase
MNYWHDVDSGTKKEINVIIEIPKGSKNKYEIDKETGLIALDRAMHTAQDYPIDYGFVPRTLWDDDDAVDAIVLTTYPLSPGILVRIRPIGIMNMIDSGEADDKLIGVPVDDPRWGETKDIKHVNKHTLKEIEHFFLTYKKLQNKEVSISGFKGKQEAEKAFLRGQELYNKKFKA